ncbi:hypothetical protein GW17_00029164 [Ensete ventricosum]|nr:hypothetical protein GW17_00029164 [Ensete ventricosum]
MAQKSVRPTLSPSPPTPALPAATFPETRRRTLIIKEPEKPGARLAEVAGSTAAGCAALCCCPCGLANLIVVVLKLPVGLVRRWRKRGAKTKPSIWRPEVDAFYDDDDDLSLYLGGFPLASSGSEQPWLAKSPSPELVQLEKEMVAKFYGTGEKGSGDERTERLPPSVGFPLSPPNESPRSSPDFEPENPRFIDFGSDLWRFALGMEEETAKMEKHLSSAAAFVEGGIQDSCDDACSICLEEFCESDPSALGGNDAELEERIMQHLAAAAAMGRVHHISRREGHRGRGGSHRHSQTSISRSFLYRTFAGQSSPVVHDRPGPSDLQSFSESLRSRLNAVSMRYKESITKSTRGWRERLFSRNSAVADLGSEARSEVNAGVDTSSRMVDRLETRENRTDAFTFHDAEVHSASEVNHEGVTGNHVDSHPSDGTSSAPCCATSSPN